MTSATQLRILQFCARRAVIERHWRVRKQRPRALFNTCLEQMVLSISRGEDPQRAGLTAYTNFVTAAREPGLDVPHGTTVYDLAMDFACALRVVAEILKRMVLLPLKLAAPVNFIMADDSGYTWMPESFEDESGALHWWHAIESYDMDTLTRYGHSWIWGDMAACRAPLTLHLVEIGYVRHGHLHGDLTRIYQHPTVAKYQFQKKDGKELTLGWKVKWLQDLGPKIMPESRWCDLLRDNHVEPIHHVTLKQPEEWQYDEFVNEVVAESDRLAQLPEYWRDVPKWRNSCDRGCPHQPLCYGPKGATPENVGGYVRL